MTSVPDFFRPGGESRCSEAELAGVDRDVIVWSPPGQGTPPMKILGPTSIRGVWRGAESCLIGRRVLCVDDDSYLVINGRREHSIVGRRRDAIESLTIFFSGETRRAFSDRDSFVEHLRPHDDVVTPCLQTLLDARRSGDGDNDWYAAQVQRLYAAIVVADDGLNRKATAFAPASLPTRTELFRRVMTATDYVNSNYTSAVTLDDIASAASLSKYHLARLFRTLHGVSPAAYLRLKRIRAAERMIERSDADLAEIAERSGFGSRWSMFRELRRRRGMSGQRIRETWMRSAASAISPSA
ncbi:MAG TPA: AraC family transcriptional regulator [Burkholderiaceae bacterium]|nr:AraC family transcriptional regulator [Burkholderiaceae bacterium]